jgi:hypothetical protein
MSGPVLNRTQLAGLRKVGDVLIPGDEALPSFSQARCDAHADRMLRYLNDRDRAGLVTLLGVLRFCPRLLLRVLFALTTRHRLLPGPLGQLARTINLGIKGAVMTLYYSDVGEGPSIHQALHWDAKVVETGSDSAEERWASAR